MMTTPNEDDVHGELPAPMPASLAFNRVYSPVTDSSSRTKVPEDQIF